MITIFATGGTFDKIYFDALSEFSIGEPQAEPILIEANVSPAYKVISILKKDSLEINDDDRELIVNQVKDCSSSRLIVTHGTDTMVQTAKAIASSSPEKTVVMVGAMQPARMRQSDASFNLGFAFAAVQLLPAGAYVAMNGQVFPYDQVSKNREASRFETSLDKKRPLITKG